MPGITPRRPRSGTAIVCCLIFFLVHSGCATARKSPPPPAPPSYEERASLGTVGVARAHYLPKTGVKVIAKGRLAGAGAGAVAFLAGALLVLVHDLPNPDDPSQVKWWVGTAIAAIPVGAIWGAIMAMPGEEAASCEMLVRGILGRTSPQEDLQQEVLRAGAEGAESRLVPVDEAGPKRFDDVAAYDSLEGKGIHTVLEASMERIDLESDKTGSDPPLALIVEARSRLIRVRDGTVVNVNRFTQSSSPRKFAEWSADNAALLDKEYRDGVRELALAIVNWNFTKKSRSE